MRTAEFHAVEEAIEEIRAGRMIIVVDDEDRENEGDLIFAAEKATPEAINFMATYAKGLICMPMTGERLDELEICSRWLNRTPRAWGRPLPCRWMRPRRPRVFPPSNAP